MTVLWYANTIVTYLDVIDNIILVRELSSRDQWSFLSQTATVTNKATESYPNTVSTKYLFTVCVTEQQPLTEYQ